MKNFFCKLVIFMVCQGLFAQGMDEEYAALQAATLRYFEFVNHIGGDKDFDPNKSQICALECKKIFNGELQTKNREELVSQLLSIKENRGHWTINPIDIVISPQSRTVVFRDVIAIENEGAFTAIVILRYSPDFQVTEINEVFNEFKGMEHEIPKVR